MTWPARALTTLHAAAALWLAYCTVQTWESVPLWASLVMLAASITPIIAALREATHTIDMHLLGADLESATRPPAHDTGITFTEAQQQLLNRLDQDLKDTA